jgi:hypothetical protein
MSGSRRVEIVELGDDPVEVAGLVDDRAGRDTDVSEVHSALARLSEPSARAVLAPGTSAYLDLSADEAQTLALVTTGARMDIVLALSPMSEPQTIQFLARLVLWGVLRIE